MSLRSTELRTRALVLAASLVLLLAGAAYLDHPADRAQAGPRAEPAAASCAQTLLVLVPGNGEGAGSTPVSAGRTLGRVRDTFLAASTGRRTVETRVVPLRSVGIGALRTATMSAPAETQLTRAVAARWDPGIGAATDAAIGLLTERQHSCPQQRIVLAGYAQGAAVMHRTLTRMGRLSARRVVGAVLVSDPDRMRDTRALHRGRPAAGSAAIGLERRRVRRTADVPVPGSPAEVLSVCRSGDVVCHLRRQPLRIGLNQATSYLRYNADELDAAARDEAQRTYEIPEPTASGPVTGSQGVPLREQLTASVNPAHRSLLRWRAVGGVPPGLSLSSTGALVGTPTQQGTWTLQYTVRNTWRADLSREMPGSLQVTVGATHVQTSVGGDTGCTVRASRQLWCWGDNSDGQLGTRDRDNRTSPTRMGYAANWASVANGGTHTCAIRTGGGLWCWGRNDLGQVGDGTTATRLSPQRVGGWTTWSQVSANAFHTCAVSHVGALWCWGKDDVGQLGIGRNFQRRLAPRRVGSSLRWASVSVGTFHTCATRTDGSLWCWGDNTLGQLGLTTGSRNTPGEVAGSGYLSVAAQAMNSCGLQTSGAVTCWGSNFSGQLGNGTRSSSRTPVTVSGGDVFVDLAVGDRFACGVTDQQVVECWGNGYTGQLGRDGVLQSTTPVAIGSSSRFETVSAGWGHACAVGTDGVTTCWGFNSAGQVGDGTHLTRRAPVPVLED